MYQISAYSANLNDTTLGPYAAQYFFVPIGRPNFFGQLPVKITPREKKIILKHLKVNDTTLANLGDTFKPFTWLLY